MKVLWFQNYACGRKYTIILAFRLKSEKWFTYFTFYTLHFTLKFKKLI